jgi:hypothetical protein
VGFYFREPELWEGETVVHRYRANWAPKVRAIGGELFLTSQRVMFVPHRVDALFGAKDWSYRREEIAQFEIAPKQLSGRQMGVWRFERLRLTTRNGSEQVLVVKRLDSVLSEAQNWLHS